MPTSDKIKLFREIFSNSNFVSFLFVICTLAQVWFLNTFALNMLMVDLIYITGSLQLFNIVLYTVCNIGNPLKPFKNHIIDVVFLVARTSMFWLFCIPAALVIMVCESYIFDEAIKNNYIIPTRKNKIKHMYSKLAGDM